MTYKAVVAGLIERESSKWVDKLLTEHKIDFSFTLADIEEMKPDTYYIYYTSKVTIYGHKQWIIPINLYVGGVVDESGVHNSVIWKNKEHDICWMAVKETREELGIKEFKIA